MNCHWLKPTAAILFAIATFAGAGNRLHAIDSNHRYFAYGVGQRTCEDYVNFRQKKLEQFNQPHGRFNKDELYEIADKIIEHWMAGFLTAHNLYVSDTYDVVGNISMDQLQARVEKECRANSQQHFAQAMIKLVQELHPQRLKAEPRK
jgi:hypothetical protein